MLHKVGIITVQRRRVVLARPCKTHEGRKLSAGLEYDFLLVGCFASDFTTAFHTATTSALSPKAALFRTR